MPEQSHPPYVPASQTQPRQLFRWLDVNKQNGRLKRTETYIILPTFEIHVDWRGYSSIIGEFTFSSPNSFSLKINPLDFPLYPFYTLCISCIRGGIVYRYRLFTNATEVLYFEIPQYNGEVITPQFKLEIWSVPTNTIIQDEAITIYTSVLGNYDYRWNLDQPLTTANPLCTGQQSYDNGTTDMQMPLIFGPCTQMYGPDDGLVLLGNQIQQVISDNSGNNISLS